MHATHADIGEVFPEVIWHAETPLMRTAPAPMFLLSGLVRDNRFKVVLSGEGADEIMAGYDIFREAKIRRFWAETTRFQVPPGPVQPHLSVDAGIDRIGLRQGVLRPGAHGRRLPGLLAQPQMADHRQGQAVLQRGDARGRRGRRRRPDALLPRWRSTAGTPCTRPSTSRRPSSSRSTFCRLKATGWRWRTPSRGGSPSWTTGWSSSPTSCHPSLKLNGLTEKYLLKEISREWLPAEISDRPKQPYRAPIHRAFFNDSPPDYVEELLSSSAIEQSGYFNPNAVDQLVAKLKRGLPLGETDDMALAGIVSTQLVDRQFMSSSRPSPPLDDTDDVKVVVGKRSSGREQLCP